MMIRKKPPEKIAFTDGFIELYAPPELDVAKAKFYYEDYKVGIKRFYSALLAGVEVAKCIRIPQSTVNIDGTETVIIKGDKYYIKQIQFDPDTMPKTLILTLSKTG